MTEEELNQLYADAAAAAQLPKDADLKSVSDLAKRQIELEDEIAVIETKLAEKKKALNAVATQLLPTAMISMGAESFKLSGGFAITVKRQFFAGVTKERQPDAFAWLRKNKHDAIIKRQVAVEFGRGEEKFAVRVLGYLKRWHSGRKVTDKESIHAQTLQKFVRERLQFEAELVEEGKPLKEDKQLPRELFGVYELTQAVISRPEE